MKISADGVWYFSREGQQSGPLTYADLKEKADEGVLKPRTDLVWKEGMADWAPIGEVDGLFERHEVAPPPPEPDAATLDAVLGEDPRSQQHVFGGSRRCSYLFVHLILPALLVFLLDAAKTSFAEQIPSGFIAQAERFGPIVLAIMTIYIGIQRFANLGMSRWWYLGHFVPFLNLWTTYRCFACPEGYAVHKQMDGPGVFLAILYWLFLLAVVAIVTAIVAILAGAAGSPEFQQQLKDALEQVRTQTQTQAAPK